MHNDIKSSWQNEWWKSRKKGFAWTRNSLFEWFEMFCCGSHPAKMEHCMDQLCLGLSSILLSCTFLLLLSTRKSFNFIKKDTYISYLSCICICIYLHLIRLLMCAAVLECKWCDTPFLNVTPPYIMVTPPYSYDHTDAKDDQMQLWRWNVKLMKMILVDAPARKCVAKCDKKILMRRTLLNNVMPGSWPSRGTNLVETLNKWLADQCVL